MLAPSTYKDPSHGFNSQFSCTVREREREREGGREGEREREREKEREREREREREGKPIAISIYHFCIFNKMFCALFVY